MARLTNPLFSLSASGTLSKHLTYRSTRRGPVCLRYSKPTGSPSNSQKAVRSFTGQLMKAWPTFTQSDRDTWAADAAQDHIPPIAFYCRYNYERLKRGWDPTSFYPGFPGKRIYHSQTPPLSISDWVFSFDGPGEANLHNKEVWVTTNLTSMVDGYAENYDGILSFNDFPLLWKVDFSYSHLHYPPTFSNCPLIRNLQLNHNQLYEIDSLFIWIYENLSPLTDGVVYADAGMDGINNASPTAASLAARTALTAPNGNWRLYFNP